MSHSLYNEKPTPGMHNDDKQMVDLYIPRKCAATNKILHAKDKSSVQINIAEVNEDGTAKKEKTTVILSGYIRSKGLGDSSLDRILRDQKILPFK